MSYMTPKPKVNSVIILENEDLVKNAYIYDMVHFFKSLLMTYSCFYVSIPVP